MHISFSSFATPVGDSSELHHEGWDYLKLALSLGNCSVDLYIALFLPV